MNNELLFTLNRLSLDEDYQPSDNTRATTNFANLARGESRKQNLRNALKMIDNRFNALAHWDNPNADRYRLELDIISVDVSVKTIKQNFPSIEILKTNIIDTTNNSRIDGVVGNNFSSYVRDYDFSILLSKHNKGRSKFSVPHDFGELHGKLFQCFVHSAVYKNNFTKPPVICLSVSDAKIYRKTQNQHPVLGVEYMPNESSLTEKYFQKMGLCVRYFMPPNSVAPLAFYYIGDLVNDYTNLELISTISTMETFQKIYRPEIYNANAVAGQLYQPNLKNRDYSRTHVTYDRNERSRLSIEQGKFAEKHFIKPYQTVLDKWSAHYSVSL